MKLTDNHIESLVRSVIFGLEKKNLIRLAQSRDKILKSARDILKNNFDQEIQLERDVMKMLDEIEKQQTRQFERHKMFKMLKKKVAEERGFVL